MDSLRTCPTPGARALPLQQYSLSVVKSFLKGRLTVSVEVKNAIPEVLSFKGDYNLAVGRFCQTDKLHHSALVRDKHLLFVKQGPESQYPTR